MYSIESQLMLRRNMSPPCSSKTSGGLSTEDKNRDLKKNWEIPQKKTLILPVLVC
jgi:hypothetical protein